MTERPIDTCMCRGRIWLRFEWAITWTEDECTTIVPATQLHLAADPGGQGPPPVPVKTSHKKMATTGSLLYLMFLAPPLTILDPILKYDIFKTYLGMSGG